MDKQCLQTSFSLGLYQQILFGAGKLLASISTIGSLECVSFDIFFWMNKGLPTSPGNVSQMEQPVPECFVITFRGQEFKFNDANLGGRPFIIEDAIFTNMLWKIAE